MSLLVVPNVFANGTGPSNIIDATQMNANFTAVATAVNNIYPSQIIPTTTVQATFGGTQPYLFLAPAIGTTPLTVSGITSQTADIFDVTLTSGGAIAFSVSKSGIAATATGASAGGINFGNGTTAQTGGISFTSNVFTIQPTNSTGIVSQFNANGTLQIEPTINATNTLGYIPPAYTAAGAATAADLHIVSDTITASAGSTTVTLTGSAVFTGTKFVVYVLDTTANTIVTPTIVSSSSFSFTSTNGHVYFFFCCGV